MTYPEAFVFKEVQIHALSLAVVVVSRSKPDPKWFSRLESDVHDRQHFIPRVQRVKAEVSQNVAHHGLHLHLSEPPSCGDNLMHFTV
ncbi:hypothetical protein CEXT_294521 [Caerostris extrusa]|uniref:Uncharacterized protein n=1 Tax=Caerostris extrusa TaxID=172846 RepID=A0AAV4R4Y8_CAEEX|nr:hypothetical protein CEXT_294521 [Caerostris extrusa]